MLSTTSEVSHHPALSLPQVNARRVLLAAILAAGAWAIWTMPETLSLEGRKVLTILLAAILGWVGTRLADSIVAISAAVALVLSGAIPEGRLFATLGSDLVWLLLAAFVIAAVLRESGVAERVVSPILRRRPTVLSLTVTLTLVIAATAFLLPSTSARAALLLPVFAVLVSVLPDPRLARGFSLLFPSVILLSAGSSLIGAGAHVVAVEAISGATGLRLGYLGWLLMGAPLGFLASLIAAGLILWLFVPRDLWLVRLNPVTRPALSDPRRSRILCVLAVMVGLWVTQPLHGLSIVLVALIGALVLLTPPFVERKTKDVFRAVDTELLVYLAATMLIAQAMTASGTDRWMAAGALNVLPPEVARHGVGIAIALSVIAVAAHLIITSRSARAAVLIPAVALPVAGLGHDAALTVLIVTMGTGFCQTLMVSAKPAAIYGNHQDAGFSQKDLFRLALPLAPIKIALLVGFATWVWPMQLEGLRGGGADRVIIASVTATAAPEQMTSPRPKLRPVTTAAKVSPHEASRPTARSAPRPATLKGTLKQAQRQIQGDLSRAREQVRRSLRHLF